MSQCAFVLLKLVNSLLLVLRVNILVVAAAAAAAIILVAAVFMFAILYIAVYAVFYDDVGVY